MIDRFKYRVFATISISRKPKKEMFYITGYRFNLDNSITTYTQNKHDLLSTKTFKEYHLMQCTGKENNLTPDLVYESDILKDCDLERWLVYWDKDYSQFLLKNIKINTVTDFLDMRIFEIIGNIYENPELLTRED